MYPPELFVKFCLHVCAFFSEKIHSSVQILKGFCDLTKVKSHHCVPASLKGDSSANYLEVQSSRNKRFGVNTFHLVEIQLSLRFML